MLLHIFDRSKESVLESGMNHGVVRCGREVCGVERNLEKVGVDGEGENLKRVGALLRDYDGFDGRIVRNVVYKKVSIRTIIGKQGLHTIWNQLIVAPSS
jgi:hypothetical protein